MEGTRPHNKALLFSEKEAHSNLLKALALDFDEVKSFSQVVIPRITRSVCVESCLNIPSTHFPPHRPDLSRRERDWSEYDNNTLNILTMSPNA